MRPSPTLALPLLAALLAAAAVAAPAAPCAAASCPPDDADAARPQGYRGDARLSDDELRFFIERLGDRFPPGSRLPRWAPRFVERARAGFADPPAGRAAPPPSQATVGPNVNVSSDPARVHSETFDAIDRRDPRRLVGAANQINANPQILFASADAGATWTSRPMSLGAATFHSDPGVTWDSRGTAYSSSLGIHNNGQTEIQVVKSTDGGLTWSSPPVVIDTDPSYDKELIAANHQTGTACPDLVCVAWDDAISGRLLASCSPQAAGPWTVATLALGDDVIGAVPAFGPTGAVAVAWSNIAQNRLELSVSTDCGATWSPPSTIAATRVAYDFAIPAMCTRRVLVYPALDIDRSPGPRRGAMYVAWSDAHPGTTCPSRCNGCPDANCSLNCSSDVFFSRSSDGGLTWDPPTQVNTDPATNDDQFNPWLAVDDVSGTIHVMWDDTRNDPARHKADVYHRSSTDGGLTWSAETRVTTASTDETTAGSNSNQYGDYSGIAAHSCSAWPIWTDRRAGGFEQAYTAVVSEVPFTAPTTACTGVAVTVTVTSPAPCAIDCGDGSPPFTACTAPCTYPLPGVYIIRGGPAGSFSLCGQPITVTACCAVPPGLATGLLAVRRPTPDDATFTWNPDPASSDGYDVWSVAAKQDIPLANAMGGPAATAVCVPTAVESCVATGAVPGPGGTHLYYQVKGVCGGAEGP